VRALYRGNEPQPKNKVQKYASLSAALNYLLKIKIIKKKTKQVSSAIDPLLILYKRIFSINFFIFNN